MFDILQIFDNDFRSEYLLREVSQSARPKFRFDAYIPKYRIAAEYDGKGHFGPLKINSKISNEQAEEEFQRTQVRDQYKNTFCTENNIQLFRIDGRIYKDDELKRYMLGEIIPTIAFKINYG